MFQVRVSKSLFQTLELPLLGNQHPGRAAKNGKQIDSKLELYKRYCGVIPLYPFPLAVLVVCLSSLPLLLDHGDKLRMTEDDPTVALVPSPCPL